MAKKINVEGHVKRYADTDLVDVKSLIDGLNTLCESRRLQEITDCEERLAALKRGETPPTPVVEKITRKRSTKKDNEAEV
jgi:hypothetical protein